MLSTKRHNQQLVADAIKNAVCNEADEVELLSRATDLKMSTNAHWHSHFAMERGYVKKNRGYIREYSGRLGEGIKICHPNRTCYNRYAKLSNRYYVVEYILIG